MPGYNQPSDPSRFLSFDLDDPYAAFRTRQGEPVPPTDTDTFKNQAGYSDNDREELFRLALGHKALGDTPE